MILVISAPHHKKEKLCFVLTKMINYVATVNHVRQLKVSSVKINDGTNGEMGSNGTSAKTYLIVTGC